MWHMGDGWGWWMIIGWVWMIVIWALIIWGILALARGGWRNRSEAPRQTGLSALDILERRYASGELTDDQFEQMRQRLLETSAPRGNPQHEGNQRG